MSNFSGAHQILIHPLFDLKAESEGFKPPIPKKGIPDFESSAFGHSANFPIRRCKSTTFFSKCKGLTKKTSFNHLIHHIIDQVCYHVRHDIPSFRPVLGNHEREGYKDTPGGMLGSVLTVGNAVVGSGCCCKILPSTCTKCRSLDIYRVRMRSFTAQPLLRHCFRSPFT